jgi:hypothetical protein
MKNPTGGAPHQQMRDYTPDEETRTRASIQEWGVQAPVLLDLDGHVVDGHNRLRIARELGIDAPEVILPVRGDDAHALAVELNVTGRHVTKADRQQYVLRRRGQGASQRTIAEELGVAQKTVGRDLAEAGESNDSPAVRGRDGKTYTTRRPATNVGPPAAPKDPALVELENIEIEIDKALFVLSGNLRHIREQQSYRVAGDATFNAYVARRWDAVRELNRLVPDVRDANDAALHLGDIVRFPRGRVDSKVVSLTPFEVIEVGSAKQRTLDPSSVVRQATNAPPSRRRDRLTSTKEK